MGGLEHCPLWQCANRTGSLLRPYRALLRVDLAFTPISNYKIRKFHNLKGSFPVRKLRDFFASLLLVAMPALSSVLAPSRIPKKVEIFSSSSLEVIAVNFGKATPNRPRRTQLRALSSTVV